MEESWGEIQDYLIEVFDWAGVDAIEAEELAVVPGLDEVFALSDIKTHADSGEWDVLVVDCAPTAETIRLLSLPDILAWYMERVFPMGRRVNRMIGPVLSRVTQPAGGRRRRVRRRPPVLRPPRRGEGAARRPERSRASASSSTPSGW